VYVVSQDLTIKKGNRYFWGTVTTKDKVGNAFIRASADKLGFDEVKEIKILSSLPASLAVNIFPEKVPATVKRDLDVIVSLVDSDGLPTLAQEDVKLEFFSDDVSINNQIDRKIKEESLKGLIKKGEFSYHFTQRLDFYKENQTITIGASTKGLGVSTDTFETVKPITTNNPIAENKTLATFTLDMIPTKSETIAVYQIGMLVDEEDDDSTESTTTESSTTEKKQVFFPLIINENYDSSGSEQKINIISSNDLLLKVNDAGQINAASSYGAAIIETGQETGQVLLAATIKGIGSSSTVTEIINTLKQEQTMLFSPTGSDSILFDNNGRFDFFVISLDTRGRPTLVENEIRYLITPINEIVTIQKAKTFAHVNFLGNTIQSENDDSMNIKTVPIGESADVRLEAQNTFFKEPTAKLAITLPHETMNQDSEYSGIIQIVDFNDNPVILNSDLRVKLSASEIGMLEMPENIMISAGKSYAEFPVSTTDKTGKAMILANGKGIVESESEIEVKTLATKLKISFGSVIEPVVLEEPTELKIYVDDEAQNAVGGATVKVISSDSSITPDSITTNAEGVATVQFNAQKSPKISLEILASAEGYSEDTKTVEFDVDGTVETARTELPPWIIYAAIGSMVAIGGGIFTFLRKPKKIQDEDEIYE
ncbi:MAG: Ig-like domain-containing protein, partial [Candidatus Nitrosotenuis sp.]